MTTHALQDHHLVRDASVNRVPRAAPPIAAIPAPRTGRTGSAGIGRGAPDHDSDLRARESRAPRYTSYPSADRFVDAFGPAEHARHLGLRGSIHGPPRRSVAGFEATGRRGIDFDRIVVTERGRRTALRPISAEFDAHRRSAAHRTDA